MLRNSNKILAKYNFNPAPLPSTSILLGEVRRRKKKIRT